MKGPGFLVFVLLTIVCWGVYGPVLHEGQIGMGGGGGVRSLLRPIVGVGVAYFLIAVVFPVAILANQGEKGHWTVSGFFWSFVAGASGALGAVGIALAYKFGGSPLYVMPLVFGFAPVVNTLVTMLMSKTLQEASTSFYLGVLIVAIGAAGVMVFKPTAAKKAAGSPPGWNSAVLTLTSHEGGGPAAFRPVPVTAARSHQDPVSEPAGAAAGLAPEGGGKPESGPAVVAGSAASGDAAADHGQPPPPDKNVPLIIFSIGLTAVCWGAYGPVLHRGQLRMAGSRMRPFLCVGLAYFVLAVIMPVLLLQSFPEAGGWWNGGLFWSVLAGAAGAFGALGIIYAFNSGGRPVFVMPLVFGGAPVVNTLAQSLAAGIEGTVSPMFYLSLFLVIVGAITVLVCAPRGHAPPAGEKS